MKKLLLAVTMLIFCQANWSIGQTTLNIKPLPTDITDTQIAWSFDKSGNFDDANYSDRDLLHSMTWTHNGQLKLFKSLLKFTLEDLPSEAIISSATLYLYGNLNPSLDNDEHLFDNTYMPNEAWMSRISESWNPKTVTWNNQPTISYMNRVTMATSTSGNQNYEVDVTTLLMDAINTQDDSLGVMIQIKDSINYYTSMVFHSSSATDEALRPELVIEYTTNVSTNELTKSIDFHLYPNPGKGDLNINLELAKNEDVKINVADITGKTVYSVSYKQIRSLQENISLRENASGIYFVSVRYGKNAITKKWVLQK